MKQKKKYVYRDNKVQSVSSFPTVLFVYVLTALRQGIRKWAVLKSLGKGPITWKVIP